MNSNVVTAIAIGTVTIFASVGATVGVAIWQDRRSISISSLISRNEPSPENGSGPGERSTVNNQLGSQPPTPALHHNLRTVLSQQEEHELEVISGKQRGLGPNQVHTEPSPESSIAPKGPLQAVVVNTSQP